MMSFSCLYNTDLCIFVRMKKASHGGFFQHIQKSMYRLLARHERAPGCCPFKSVCNKQKKYMHDSYQLLYKHPPLGKGHRDIPCLFILFFTGDGGPDVVNHIQTIDNVSSVLSVLSRYHICAAFSRCQNFL